MARWQQALNEADAWLTQFTTGTARQRVARLLLRLACPASDHRLRLFGREDMAAMVGLTTETVSRTIAELRNRQPHYRRAAAARIATRSGCSSPGLRPRNLAPYRRWRAMIFPFRTRDDRSLGVHWLNSSRISHKAL